MPSLIKRLVYSYFTIVSFVYMSISPSIVMLHNYTSRLFVNHYVK